MINVLGPFQGVIPPGGRFVLRVVSLSIPSAESCLGLQAQQTITRAAVFRRTLF